MGDNAASPDTLNAHPGSTDTSAAPDEGPTATTDVPADAGTVPARTRRRFTRLSALWNPVAIGLVAVVASSALMGWWGFQSYQIREARLEGTLFLQAARQAALNLTTIDWQRADDDVKRIMDSAAGEFYDDFAQRAQPFVEVVKQAQSVSVGTVTEAALESLRRSEAQALVAVSVSTLNATGAEPVPRAWRMRISVQELDGQIKVTHVEFVP